MSMSNPSSNTLQFLPSLGVSMNSFWVFFGGNSAWHLINNQTLQLLVYFHTQGTQSPWHVNRKRKPDLKHWLHSKSSPLGGWGGCGELGTTPQSVPMIHDTWYIHDTWLIHDTHDTCLCSHTRVYAISFRGGTLITHPCSVIPNADLLQTSFSASAAAVWRCSSVSPQ